MRLAKKILVATCMVMLGTSAIVNTAYSETSKQYVKSSAITADIKAKLLADPDVKSLHISVKTTKKDVVILTGHVETADQKDKAASIAASADGVTSVTNKLVVKAAK
jgi:hyperosmotically inducible periplasmic protein